MHIRKHVLHLPMNIDCFFVMVMIAIFQLLYLHIVFKTESFLHYFLPIPHIFYNLWMSAFSPLSRWPFPNGKLGYFEAQYEGLKRSNGWNIMQKLGKLL